MPVTYLIALWSGGAINSLIIYRVSVKSMLYWNQAIEDEEYDNVNGGVPIN